MQTLKVKEVMSAHPIIARPTQTVEEVAKMMRDHDCGIIPVGTVDKLIGVITDRDITVRVTAAERNPALLTVDKVMSHSCIYCDINDSLKHVAELMRKHNVSRIIVTDDQEVIGIVTIADLLRNRGDRRESDKALHELLGRKPRAKKCASVAMGTAGAGSEGCDMYDEAI